MTGHRRNRHVTKDNVIIVGWEIGVAIFVMGDRK